MFVDRVLKMWLEFLYIVCIMNCVFGVSGFNLCM